MSDETSTWDLVDYLPHPLCVRLPCTVQRTKCLISSSEYESGGLMSLKAFGNNDRPLEWILPEPWILSGLMHWLKCEIQTPTQSNKDTLAASY